MLKTFFIFLCIIFFSQILSLPVTSENNLSIGNQEDESLTKNTLKVLDEILHRIKQLNSTINYHLNYFRGNNTKTNRKTSRENNVMENSGYYQGDIKLSKHQAEDLIDTVAEIAEDLGADVTDIVGDAETRKKRKIDTRPKFTWGLKVPYVVDYHVDRNLIRKALDKLQSETCLEFIEYSGYIPSGEAGLKYFPGEGCYSSVGRQSLDRLQDISIGKGCEFISTIQHETMHALGFEHEQSRVDRDMYLKIFLDNIEQGKIENFMKLPLTNSLDYGLQYDYGSVMHYNSHSFSKNGKPTMLPHNSVYHTTMGSRSEATFLDIMMLNLYFCKDICLNRIACRNNGYPNPNDCKRCKCIRGFTGRDCSEIEKDRLCGNQELFADGTEKLLYVDGEKDCVYHIKSKSRNRILIEVKTVSIYPTYDYSCRAENKLEVKFQSNKATSGAFVCDKSTKTFESENDHVMIRFTSTNKKNFANIYYK